MKLNKITEEVCVDREVVRGQSLRGLFAGQKNKDEPVRGDQQRIMTSEDEKKCRIYLEKDACPSRNSD